MIEAFIDWLQSQAESERRAGYGAQMRGQAVIAATHIGREFAYYQAVAELRERIGSNDKLAPGELDPRD